MNLKLACLVLMVGLALSAGVYGITFAAENRDAEIILIDGGKARDVHFPHHSHQKALGDCGIINLHW